MNYMTRNRRTILEYIRLNSDKSVTVSDIMDYLCKSDIKTNITTVYRYLDKLIKDGIVVKNSVCGTAVSAYRYSSKECSAHLHIQCGKCGKLIHMDCVFTKQIEKHMLSYHNFSLDCGKSMLYGVCGKCMKEEEK